MGILLEHTQSHVLSTSGGPKPDTRKSSFHFLFHYPNITPIFELLYSRRTICLHITSESEQLENIQPGLGRQCLQDELCETQAAAVDDVLALALLSNLL